MWGAGQCGKKNLLHCALEATILLNNPLKSPVEAHEIKLPMDLDFFGPQMALA
jgi:hypothetical protein